MNHIMLNSFLDEFEKIAEALKKEATYGGKAVGTSLDLGHGVGRLAPMKQTPFVIGQGAGRARTLAKPVASAARSVRPGGIQSLIRGAGKLLKRAA